MVAFLSPLSSAKCFDAAGTDSNVAHHDTGNPTTHAHEGQDMSELRTLAQHSRTTISWNVLGANSGRRQGMPHPPPESPFNSARENG